MYVSYLLDKDVSMYPSSVRHSGGLNLAPQNFVGAPQYPDYGGYHVAAAAAAAANLDSAQSPAPSWPAAYGAPLREDWNGYAPGGAANAVAHGLNGGAPATAMGYGGAADYHPHHHAHHAHHHAHHPAAAPSCASGLLQTLNPVPAGPPASAAAEQLSPGGQRRNLCEWMRKPAQPALGSQGERGRLAGQRSRRECRRVQPARGETGTRAPPLRTGCAPNPFLCCGLFSSSPRDFFSREPKEKGTLEPRTAHGCVRTRVWTPGGT